MSKPGNPPTTKDEYTYLHPIQTRWADNDIYGHINNVAYYAFFDTAVNAYLIDQCGLDIHHGDVIGLVVETGCKYFAPLEYPSDLFVGVRVARIGTSSVIYETAIFSDQSPFAAAEGRFVHVYVTREDRRPTPLPDTMRQGLEKITRD